MKYVLLFCLIAFCFAHYNSTFGPGVRDYYQNVTNSSLNATNNSTKDHNKTSNYSDQYWASNTTANSTAYPYNYTYIQRNSTLTPLYPEWNKTQFSNQIYNQTNSSSYKYLGNNVTSGQYYGRYNNYTTNQTHNQTNNFTRNSSDRYLSKNVTNDQYYGRYHNQSHNNTGYNNDTNNQTNSTSRHFGKNNTANSTEYPYNYTYAQRNETLRPAYNHTYFNLNKTGNSTQNQTGDMLNEFMVTLNKFLDIELLANLDRDTAYEAITSAFEQFDQTHIGNISSMLLDEIKYYIFSNESDSDRSQFSDVEPELESKFLKYNQHQF